MKVKPPVIAILFLVCLSACAQSSPKQNAATLPVLNAAETTLVSDSFTRGKIIESVSCKSAPQQTFALYIPQYKKEALMPVVYFFDPHGKGSYPLSKYKAIADSLHFIFVGSNESKNGQSYAITASLWNTLFSDTKTRLPIDANRIYLCGFSGGAKAATYIAIKQNNIKAVIANSAGLPDGAPITDLPFSITALAGEGDMNLTDMLELNGLLSQTKTQHHLIIFKGIHEWAPANTMQLAMEGLQLDAMRSNTTPVDETFIANLASEGKKEIDANTKSGNLLKAEQAASLYAGLLKGLGNNDQWFSSTDAEIKSSDRYKEQVKQRDQLLAKEENIKQGYAARFQSQDISYWQASIADLNNKVKLSNSESAMYQRLLAYLSLAFYSFTNRSLSSNDIATADYFDQLYKTADPTNSEAWYFSAIINANKKNTEQVKKDLKKAINLGFNDAPRMLQEPAFQPIAAQLQLAAMASAMH